MAQWPPPKYAPGYISEQRRGHKYQKAHSNTYCTCIVTNSLGLIGVTSGGPGGPPTPRLKC